MTPNPDLREGEVQAHKREFIDFMVRSEVLTFGDFTAKSGRRTPYFVNTGRYQTGEQLARLGQFYATAIELAWPDRVDVLFGPAYKGIPLVATTAIALAAAGRNTRFCFNRKEPKDHGEGGSLVGSPLVDGDRVLIVEDVTTAGTSIRETVPMLRSVADIELAGLVVSVDRQERGNSERSALADVGTEFEMSVHAIVTLDDIVGDLRGREIDGRVVIDDATMARIDAYRSAYGAL